MNRARRVVAGGVLAHDQHVCATAGESLHSRAQRFRRGGRPGHEKTRSRLGGTENLHRAAEGPVLGPQWNDCHVKRHFTTVGRKIYGRKILDPIESGFQGKGQRAGVFTIDTTRGQSTPPAQ